MTVSLAAELTHHVLEQIKKLEPVREIIQEENVYKVLRDPQTGDVLGDIRVFAGSELLERVVLVHLAKQSINLDAYMVAAFTRPASLYPHLVFDCEIQPEDCAFHIDLLHKKDLSTEADYINDVLEPLSPAFDEVHSKPHFRPSAATKLMKTLLNAWMVSYHTHPDHLSEARPVIDAYCQHWLSLKDKRDGIRFDGEERAEYAAYDQAHRLALFNPQVDILWDILVNLIGLESRDLLLGLLRGTHK
jgi:hypothetical protein